MERFFNTAGPQQPDIHYTIDPLSRFELDDVLMLIRQRKYFVLHAPRQTGKTSCMLALRDLLNRQGDYIAVYANVEGGQASRDNVKSVVKSTVDTLALRVSQIMGDPLAEHIRDTVQGEGPDSMLSTYLSKLSQALPKPLVLIIDEIDALVGDSLISVLRQIRSGYENRPQAFPNSIILCGVRDVRDYRIQTSGKDIVTGGSAFNIKSKSLRLGNFTPEEVHKLYMQHTEETGQQFDEACFPMIWQATEGQPWLVNALGYEVTWEIRENRDRSVLITPDMIYRAKEQIIYRRDTHIDILIDKLSEPRVKRVIEPILSNSDEPVEGLVPSDDIQYVADMGLIKIERGQNIRISNGIYREIIPRELTWSTQQSLLQQPQWYQREDGGIDMEKLLLAFQQFFRENSDAWIGRFDYAEAGPQLLLQAFLQRIVNGGGYIDREYGLGRRRTDLLIRKPLPKQPNDLSPNTPTQRIVLELKIKRKKDGLDALIEKGLEQTAEYMDTVGSVDEGHLIIFNRDGLLTWDERIWHRLMTYQGRSMMVWGM
ncbi:MAG: ATP-binding protein [Prevotella sp.]|nr:ATP-binding protein [Prevotella sp.]